MPLSESANQRDGRRGTPLFNAFTAGNPIFFGQFHLKSSIGRDLGAPKGFVTTAGFSPPAQGNPFKYLTDKKYSRRWLGRSLAYRSISDSYRKKKKKKNTKHETGGSLARVARSHGKIIKKRDSPIVSLDQLSPGQRFEPQRSRQEKDRLNSLSLRQQQHHDSVNVQQWGRCPIQGRPYN